MVSVRYIVDDVDSAIAFYTDQLGFRLDMHPAPPFAMLSRGELRLLNRFQVEVADLEAEVERLRAAGASFRQDEIVSGVGGKQIIIDDPSGNAVELFQPA
jgi:predicted enzyme related to lactoylglutathione lyase